MQRIPVDDEGSPGRFMLFIPVDQQVETSVVDVVEMLEIDVQFHVVWNLLKHFGKHRKPNECRGPFKAQDSFLVRLVDIQMHDQMRERVQEFYSRQSDAGEHAGQQIGYQR